jgi:thiol-disulfide isomerase/thioredoxin
MRLLSISNILRQRGFGPFAGLFFIASLLFIPPSIQAGQNNHVTILYYFSMTCRHCLDAKPAIVELSRQFTIEGQNVGNVAAEGYPFPVKPADKKKSKEVYKVQGVPTLVVFVNKVHKQNIAGTRDIDDAAVVIKALDHGAMTVTDAAEKAPEGDITVVGWIAVKGEYFNNAQFLITDRKTDLQVKAWLPLEAMKSMVPNANRPRLMSDVIRKPVVLKGHIIKSATGNLFLVKEEIPVD